MYNVYIKSHCEAPDFEASFSESQLKHGGCPMPYADDFDEEGRALVVKCGGKLIPLGSGGYRCGSCGTEYFLENK